VKALSYFETSET